jgi:hypothetical protein
VFRLWSYRSSNVEMSAEEGLGVNGVEFSYARYEPMARLMNDEDLLFLKAQPGFRPGIAKKFTRERRRIFRLYLQELALDFHRLHAHAREIVAGLPAENSQLVGMLIRQKFRFWYEMTALELRLSLNMPAVVNARALIDVLAAMHAEISRVAVPSVA